MTALPIDPQHKYFYGKCRVNFALGLQNCSESLRDYIFHAIFKKCAGI